MSTESRDIQHVLTKSYFPEKAQDSMERNPDIKQAYVSTEYAEQKDVERRSVVKSSSIEGNNTIHKGLKSIQVSGNNKKDSEPDRQTKKDIAKPKFSYENGLMLDMDA